VAAACGAWAQGIVTKADLSFTSRLPAAAAPTRLRERAFVESATGFLAAHQDIGMRSLLPGSVRQQRAPG